MYICIDIATLEAAGVVDDRDMEAANKGSSETRAQSVQESNKTEAPECVDMDTTPLACRKKGVLRLLMTQRTSEPTGGGCSVPLLMVMVMSHPANAAEA